MIHPTELAVRRPDVRRILRCLLHLTVQTAQMAASMPVITPATWIARPELQLPTPAVAAAQPVTDVIPKLVIILINPAAHRAVPVIPDVLAALIPFLTDAAVPVQNVLPAAVRLLITGAPFTQPVTGIAVLTEPWNHAIRNAAAQVAAARGEAPAGVVQNITHGNGVMFLMVELTMYIQSNVFVRMVPPEI